MASPKPLQVFQEPLDTPGLIPMHLKRAAAFQYPLLEVMQRILSRAGSGIDMSHALALISVFHAAKPVYNILTQWFLAKFTSRVTIYEYDPIAKDILAYMSTQVMAKSTTTSAVISTAGFSKSSGRFYHDPMLRGMRRSTEQSDEPQMLSPGRIVGFRPFLFTRSHSKSQTTDVIEAHAFDQGQLQNAITLTTMGWSLDPLQKFVKNCHEYRVKNMHGTTTIYFSSPSFNTAWDSVTKAVRKMDTVDIEEHVKSDLIKDAEYYYSPDSKRFFADCGIPYRRGYLFHGPPGTGKTSFSAALAGHLACDLYIINLAWNNLDDCRLHKMFLTLPKKCVVVIEDIDSAGIGREQSTTENEPIPPGASHPALAPEYPDAPPIFSMKQARKQRNMVTLSGLLNAIDGNASQEGRLLIMNSNNPDTLDEALLRPGRMDKKVYFGYMTPLTARRIFHRLIGRMALQYMNISKQDLDDYATRFAAKIPVNTVTPAQVQNFLQDCRGDIAQCFREVDTWIEETRKKPAETALPKMQSNRMGNGTSPGSFEMDDFDLQATLMGLAGDYD